MVGDVGIVLGYQEKAAIFENQGSATRLTDPVCNDRANETADGTGEGNENKIHCQGQ